ncbi:Protein of unknown function [Gryllus bimaculatus]|nr:Protein of unknown function [Gryllus bimaculatus]
MAKRISGTSHILVTSQLLIDTTTGLIMKEEIEFGHRYSLLDSKQSTSAVQHVNSWWCKHKYLPFSFAKLVHFSSCANRCDQGIKI